MTGINQCSISSWNEIKELDEIFNNIVFKIKSDRYVLTFFLSLSYLFLCFFFSICINKTDRIILLKKRRKNKKKLKIRRDYKYSPFLFCQRLISIVNSHRHHKRPLWHLRAINLPATPPLDFKRPFLKVNVIVNARARTRIHETGRWLYPAGARAVRIYMHIYA